MARRWFLAGLAVIVLAAPASARMHAPYRGHRIVPAGAAPPLDGLAAPSGAYSFRKLRTAYAGPAIRLRRASDQAELDINFLGCTSFTGCPWDSAAAASHCASTTCFGSVWYDQSGNSRDLTQPTTANQLQLVFNCIGVLPCFRTTSNLIAFTGASFTPATGLVSFSAVGQKTEAVASCSLLRENGANNRLQIAPANTSWQVVGNAGAVVSVTTTLNAWGAGAGVLDGANSVLNVNGTEVTPGTSPVGNTTAGTPQIVSQASGSCNIGETMWWDNVTIGAAPRSAIVGNQRAYWGF